MRNDMTLEEYIHGNSFNTDIYDALTEHKDYADLFDPLEYFNFLYQEFEFFDKNKENLIQIREHYRNIRYHRNILLTGLPRYFFFLTFIGLIEDMYPVDLESLSFPTFSDVANRSYSYLRKMHNDSLKESYPDAVTEPKESESPISPIPALIQEKLNNNSLEVEEITGANSTLRQKMLVIKYLQQFKLLNLTTIHQDQTKQAQILSFLMGQVSANTTRVALGEDISVLKTKTNLEAALKLFEPLKDAFPKIMTQIETDIKNLKKK
jgi:hypothetical protein